jgi:hypothetical protein
MSRALARFVAALQAEPPPPPFDAGSRAALAEAESQKASASARRRSVLFVHNSYYHFLHLAAALRRRGWDAMLVSIASPDSDAAPYFHGEDVSLFDTDADRFSDKLRQFYTQIPGRFAMVHFAGMHHMSLFPENFDAVGLVGRAPWDFIDLRSRGVKLGYTVSGCHDGIRQSIFRAHTGVCRKCVWELHPEVCSDVLNAAWGKKVATMCDLISCEEDWALDSRTGPKAFREPLTMCLDPDLWRPDLEVPTALRLPRMDGEVIVLHGYGNIDSRTQQGRDIKGSKAVIAAVERLRSEGAPVRLERVSNVPSRQMRFLQVQADIVADQLIYGRYGAQAREGLMLGKPTICHLDNRQGPGLRTLRSLGECPLVDATEETVYDVLKALVASPTDRARIGAASRAYALKWHSADACALRYERVYDRLMEGLPPEADDVFAEVA